MSGFKIQLNMDEVEYIHNILHNRRTKVTNNQTSGPYPFTSNFNEHKPQMPKKDSRK
jgi:hypothetical protein